MKTTVFYSWQSDLPNNKNRGFIGECIEKAIGEINSESLVLEVAIDRDTKGVSGTPDIVSTIFSKIDQAAIFIADISFISSTEKGRMLPNPNVLVELGYAAKAIGWKKIICIFNTEFGKLEELPFDLRFRRPLTYSITNSKNKAIDRKNLISILKTQIASIFEEDNEKDDLKIYIKQQVDKEVITICTHLNKMLIGFDDLKLSSINNLLRLTEDELKYILFEKRFIGFTVTKDWQTYITDLENLMNQPFFIHHSDSIYTNAIIRIIKSITTLSVFQKQRNVFQSTGKKIEGYRIIDGKSMNAENPKDRFMLLKEIDHEKGIIIDSGTIRKYNIEDAAHYLTITEDFEGYLSAIYKLLLSIKNYIDKTGNEFLLDPKYFRV